MSRARFVGISLDL